MGFANTIFNWLGKVRLPGGTTADMQADAAGNLLVSVAASVPPATTWVRPQAGTPLTYERILAATAKKLHTLEVENTGASLRWIMLFDRATLYAANGAEPVDSFPVPAGGFLVIDWDTAPLAFTAGLIWHASSTAGTLTRDVAATFRVSARVE